MLSGASNLTGRRVSCRQTGRLQPHRRKIIKGRGINVKTEILYEDNDIIVAYKPAGLAAQTAKIGQQDMVSELKNYLQKKNAQTVQKRPAAYLGVIHRLDQPVEGLLVFAKNAESAAKLTRQLQRQSDGSMFHKHYYGALWGKPDKKEGELTDYLYKSKDNRAVIAEASEIKGGGLAAGAKKAALRYRVLQTIERPMGQPGEISLAEIDLLTGRFHQIRVQMAHGGTPLLGDLKYGSGESVAASRALGIQSVALCAYSLEFVHPATGERMNFRTRPRGKAFSAFSLPDLS